MEKTDGNYEIDLLGMIGYLRKKIWIVLSVTLLTAGIAFLISNFLLPREYSAATRVYVLNRSQDNTVASADFALSNYMLSDYSVLITGENVTREVIACLGLDMTPPDLVEMIQVTGESNTRILQICVTDTDPARAAVIANRVREVASEQIKKIMDVDAVNLVYEAQIPAEPSGPNVIKVTALVGGFAFFVTVFILCVIRSLNDAIASEEDVAQYLGIMTLGVIPESEGFGTDLRMAGKRGRYQSDLWTKNRNKRFLMWKKSR